MVVIVVVAAAAAFSHAATRIQIRVTTELINSCRRAATTERDDRQVPEQMHDPTG